MKNKRFESGLDNETSQISLSDSLSVPGRMCQTLALTFNSFLAVMLEAPDVILIERSSGKRIDPVTGGNVCMIITFFLVQRVRLRDRQPTRTLVRMHFIICGPWQRSTCLLNPNRALRVLRVSESPAVMNKSQSSLQICDGADSPFPHNCHFPFCLFMISVYEPFSGHSLSKQMLRRSSFTHNISSLAHKLWCNKLMWWPYPHDSFRCFRCISCHLHVAWKWRGCTAFRNTQDSEASWTYAPKAAEIPHRSSRSEVHLPQLPEDHQCWPASCRCTFTR